LLSLTVEHSHPTTIVIVYKHFPLYQLFANIALKASYLADYQNRVAQFIEDLLKYTKKSTAANAETTTTSTYSSTIRTYRMHGL
jgi:hypothetical protein